MMRTFTHFHTHTHIKSIVKNEQKKSLFFDPEKQIDSTPHYRHFHIISIHSHITHTHTN